MSNVNGQIQSKKVSASFEITITDESAEKEIKLGEVLRNIVSGLGLQDEHFARIDTTKEEVEELIKNHTLYSDIWAQMLR